MNNMYKPVVFNFKDKSVVEIQNILTSYVSRGRRTDCTPLNYVSWGKRKKKIVSVQVGKWLYSEPRCNNANFYSKAELGYPNFLFSQKFIKEYAEESSKPVDTIYPYVPLDVLASEIYNIVNKVK